MKRGHGQFRIVLAGVLGFLVLLVLGTTLLGRRPTEDPAPPAVLNEIGERNREAAMEAAMRFKEEAAEAKALERSAEAAKAETAAEGR